MPGAVPEVPEWAVPPRPRPGITFVWWLAFIAAGMLWPGWVLLLFGALLVVTGTIGSIARALRNRRLRHGLRRSDVPVASLAAPVHGVIALVLLLPSAIIGVLGGGIVWGLFAPSGVTPGLMAAVIAVTTLLTWWTPSSTRAREGAWAALDSAAGTKGSTALWILLGLAVVAGFVAAVVYITPPPTPVWTPVPTPPIPSFG